MNERARRLIDVYTQRAQSLEPDGTLHLRPSDPRVNSDLEKRIQISYFQQGTKHFIGLYHTQPRITPASVCYDEKTNTVFGRTIDPTKIRSQKRKKFYEELQQATLLIYADVMKTH